MTEEQVKIGKAILNDVDSLEKQHNDLERFITYITTKNDVNEIDIQLHEKWIGTPYAKVHKINLIGFLNAEMHRIRSSINTLREKLADL